METGRAGSWHHGIKTPYKEKTMQPHQERVVDEKRELDEKIKKLEDFIINGSVFETLDKYEQERLRQQIWFMDAYSNTLGHRIAAFKRGETIGTAEENRI
jgi:uncharacterized protein YdcH (DUF465 family)